MIGFILYLIWSVLKPVIYLVFAFVLYHVVKGTLMYLNLQKYKKQGLETHFVPLLGYLKLYLDSSGSKHSKPSPTNPDLPQEQLAMYRHFVETADPNKPGFVFNSPFSLNPVLILTHPAYIKSYIASETEFAEKANRFFGKLDVRISLFFKKGEEFRKAKSIFSQLFSFDKLAKLIVGRNGVNGIIVEELAKLAQKIDKKGQNGQNGGPGANFVDIDLSQTVTNILTRMTTIFVFGRNFEALAAEIDKKESKNSSEGQKKGLFNPIEMVTELNTTMFKTGRKPIFLLSEGLNITLGLDSDYKKARKQKAFSEEIVNKILKHASKKPDSQLGDSILDNIIRYNRQKISEGREKEVYKPDDILADINMFQIAGFDTSQHTSLTVLAVVCSDQELQQKVRKELEWSIFNCLDFVDQASAKAYSESEEFNLFMKEAMRLCSSTTRTNERTSFKTTVIRPSQAKKGQKGSNQAQGARNRASNGSGGENGAGTGELKPLKIYKGTDIIVPIQMLQRVPSTFPDPLKFDPERFRRGKVNEDQQELLRGHYLPFYAGARKCLGSNLGDLMVRVIISHFLYFFELRPRKELIGYREKGGDCFGGYRRVDGLLYGVEEPVIGVRLREGVPSFSDVLKAAK